MYWCFSSSTILNMKSGKNVCLGFFFPTREFFSHLEISPLPLKDCKFYLCSALMTFELWGNFSMPHLLWHGPTLYNGHLRGPVTLTTVVERLAVEVSLTCFNRQAVPTGDRTPISRMRGERSNSRPPRQLIRKIKHKDNVVLIFLIITINR